MPSERILQVFIFRAGEFLGTDVFAKKRVMVGRDIDSADLVLGSTHVSRRHAVIEYEGERVYIEDAGSKNGIYVNDVKTQRAEITRLDKVTIGDFSVKLKMVASTAPQPPNLRPKGDATLPMGATIEGDLDQYPAPNISDLIKLHDPADMTDGSLTPLASQSSERSAVYGEYHGTDDEDEEEQDEEEQARARRAKKRGGGKAAPQRSAPPSSGKARHDARHDAGYDDGHDDEDDEENFRPAYSLVKRVLADDGGDAAARSRRRPSVEVLTVVDDKIVDLSVLTPQRRTWRRRAGGFERRALGFDAGLKSASFHTSGECTVECRDGIGGNLRRGAQTIPLTSFMQSAGDMLVRGKLREGDVLSLDDGAASYYVRYVVAPEAALDNRSVWRRLALDGHLWTILISSLAAHAFIAALLTFLMPPPPPPVETPEEFVVTVKDEMQLQEKPPEPPKPPAPPAPPEKAPPTTPQKASPPRPAPRHKRVVHVALQSPAPTPTPVPAGILGLLSKRGATAAPGAAAAVAAVSNLNAVKVPGNQGSYRVSGLIGKLPASSGISVGGGSGIVTKGAHALLRGGAGSAGDLADQGDRSVGGLVQKVPRAMHSGGQGTLDRALIQKVVNEHIDEIQRCYEKELLHDAGLSGKVQVEWIIGLDGSVPSVRQMFSSVKSVTVVRCIMDSVKSWRFPKPQGGQVVVNYPFIFKSIGF